MRESLLLHPRSLWQQPSSRRGVYGSNMIESTGQETRAFILQARHTLVTSQPEVTLLSVLSLLPPCSPAGPTIGHHHCCHCIEISRAYKSPWAPHIIPPNYSRGVVAAAAVAVAVAVALDGRLVGWSVRSKLTRRRLFYFPPLASANRWKSSTQLCRAIRSHSITRDQALECQTSKLFSILATRTVLLSSYEVNEPHM